MDISFLYKKKVAIDLWQWRCQNRGEKNKIVGFHCFLTSCLLCMHHLRTYQCCWCTHWNLFVQGKLHFFHCFLTSCLLGMHHSQISIKYRMLFCRSVSCNYCPKRSSFLQIFFPLLFWQCHCHKIFSTISPLYFGNAIATNQWPRFFFFLRNDMSTSFLQYFYNKS